MFSLYILYTTRQLGIEPNMLGIILAIGSSGAFVGAVIAGRIAQWFSLGATLVGAELVGGLGVLLIPLASGESLTVPLLTTAAFLTGLGTVIYNVNQVSLRQA